VIASSQEWKAQVQTLQARLVQLEKEKSRLELELRKSNFDKELLVS